MNSKDLESKKISELKEIAKKLDIEKYYKLNKKDLLDVIKKVIDEKKEKATEYYDNNISERVNNIDKDLKKEVSITASEDIKKYISEKDDDTVYDVNTDIELTPSEEKEKRKQKEKEKEVRTINPEDLITGILEVREQGYGFVRVNSYEHSLKDSYIPKNLIDRFKLKTGDKLSCLTKKNPNNEKSDAVIWVQTINGVETSDAVKIKRFDKLVPIFPNERIDLEIGYSNLAMRVTNLMSPIGKGQRGLIVAPPKAGKTTLIKNIANVITKNHKEVELIILLIDERPEEVTDMQYSVEGAQIVYSTFDEEPENHVKTAEVILERAKRLVEHNKDVVILLDSITRLARAYNLVMPSSGRTLSGGLDPTALYGPKRFFGAARNVKGGGSLTILATALVDTGSRMDDIIFEEFKGTGNMELHLSRQLSERRIFPAIDINKSGTRKEDKLLTEDELKATWIIRRELNNYNNAEITEKLLGAMIKSKSNEDFVSNFGKYYKVK